MSRSISIYFYIYSETLYRTISLNCTSSFIDGSISIFNSLPSAIFRSVYLYRVIYLVLYLILYLAPYLILYLALYPALALSIPMSRADSRFAHSQWETALLCNDVSLWLSASRESSLMSIAPSLFASLSLSLTLFLTTTSIIDKYIIIYKSYTIYHKWGTYSVWTLVNIHSYALWNVMHLCLQKENNFLVWCNHPRPEYDILVNSYATNPGYWQKQLNQFWVQMSRSQTTRRHRRSHRCLVSRMVHLP